MRADHTQTLYGDEEGGKGEDDGGSWHGTSSPSSLSSQSPLPSFQYRTFRQHGVTRIALRGAVEDEDKEAFRKALFQGTDADGTRDIALDLGEVTFLSEEAITVLIQLLKTQRAQRAALRLVRLSPWVRRKLERTAVIQFFAVDD